MYTGQRSIVSVRHTHRCAYIDTRPALAWCAVPREMCLSLSFWGGGKFETDWWEGLGYRRTAPDKHFIPSPRIRRKDERTKHHRPPAGPLQTPPPAGVDLIIAPHRFPVRFSRVQPQNDAPLLQPACFGGPFFPDSLKRHSVGIFLLPPCLPSDSQNQCNEKAFPLFLRLTMTVFVASFS